VQKCKPVQIRPRDPQPAEGSSCRRGVVPGAACLQCPGSKLGRVAGRRAGQSRKSAEQQALLRDVGSR